MARLRLVIIGVLGLVAGSLAYRWASRDRLIDAPTAPRSHRADAGPGEVSGGEVSGDKPAPAADRPTLPIALVDVQSGLAVSGVTLAAESDTDLGDSVAGLDGAATIPATPGRWRITATGRDGDALVIIGGGDWQLGDTLPPSLVVRLAWPGAFPAADAIPAVAPGAGALVGVATLAGARAADVIVTPIFLGNYGPGHAVALDRVPAPTPLAPRRFVGTAGRFRVDGLAPGTYAALVVAPGRGAAVVRATVTDTLAGDASAELAAAASLSGAVTDQRGAPLSGATVRVRAGGLTLATIRTTRDGTYALHDLPAIELEVEARADRCVGDHAKLILPPGQRSIRALGLVCETPDNVVTSVPPVQDEP